MVVESTANLAEYGLASPSRTVAVAVEGVKDPLTVQFGAKAPDGGAVYARTPSSPKVFAVASWVESSFDKKPFDLRDRDLLHVKRDDVRQLEVTGPEGSYALARTDAGDWAFTKPLGTRAGRWSVDGLLGTVENLRMESVAAEDAKDPKEIAGFGLDPPARTVSLVLKDGSTRTLEIGAALEEPAAAATPSPAPAQKGEKPKPPEKPKPSKYYARQAGTGLVAVVPARPRRRPGQGHGRAAGQAPARGRHLRDRGLRGRLRRRQEDLRQERRPRTRTASTRRSGSAPPPTRRTSTPRRSRTRSSRWAGSRCRSSWTSPRTRAAYGLDAPVLRVVVKAKGESWIELGKKDGAYYARRNGDAAVLKLDPAKAEELVKAFTEL